MKILGTKYYFVWNATAHHKRLTYFFYQDGARSEEVAFSFLDDYGGTFQSDALKAYRKLEETHKRLSCFQHNKRKFIDCGDDPDAERGVIFYSLACSCRLNGINFFEYISDVINKAACLPPNAKPETYRNLLPDLWKKLHFSLLE